MTVKWIINLTTSIYINSKSWENNEPDNEVKVALIYQEWDLKSQSKPQYVRQLNLMLTEYIFLRWNSYFLNRYIKYSFEISLIGFVI